MTSPTSAVGGPREAASSHRVRLEATVRATAIRLESLAATLPAIGHADAQGGTGSLALRLTCVASGLREIAEEIATPWPSGGTPSDGWISSLTRRELEVLESLARGAPTMRIADELGITAATVRSYVKSVLSKLGVHSRVAAVALLLKRDGSRPVAERSA